MEDLQHIAHRAMLDRGLLPEFSKQALAQLDGIRQPAGSSAGAIRDLSGLLWASIDNDDSQDLDQLSVSEDLGGGRVKIRVAVADVDALVEAGTPIDDHARANTTSVYTAAQIFPMLPQKLSTNLTSLAAGQDRSAVVMEMVFDASGTLTDSDVYRAKVHNWAKLAYNSVAAWLDGKGPMPQPIAAVPGMEQQIRSQDAVAQVLKRVRRERGALTLETIEARAIFEHGMLTDLRADERNRAKDLIEDFMIAANGVVARFLERRGLPSLRRILRTPERWNRIAALALESGEHLPARPDPRALNAFLAKRREIDPIRFPDLSLCVVKLLGKGEYALKRAGLDVPGHFGLAVSEYTHSTAPNRRFPDLVTHRLLKAALAGAKLPYTVEELDTLARHCTEQEVNADKVERSVRKSAAALLLASRIGERFDAMVTGASEKGTWVRIVDPAVEGRVVRGFEGLDVGDRIQVELLHTDVTRGFIDFARSR